MNDVRRERLRKARQIDPDLWGYDHADWLAIEAIEELQALIPELRPINARVLDISLQELIDLGQSEQREELRQAVNLDGHQFRASLARIRKAARKRQDRQDTNE